MVWLQNLTTFLFSKYITTPYLYSIIMNTLFKTLLSLVCFISTQAFAVTTGQTLYTTNCAGCHGASPAKGTLRIGIGYVGSNVVYNSSVITTAISNYPVMSGLSFLTVTDINDIANFIQVDIATGGLPITQPITPIDNGKNLYNAMCASCHGDVTQGKHDLARGNNGPAVQGAINRVSAMNYLGTPDPQALADIGLYIATYAKGENEGIISGCTIGDSKNTYDPLWIMMILVSGIVLVVRRVK